MERFFEAMRISLISVWRAANRRHQRGGLTPTYRRPGRVDPQSQIDHLFVTRELAARLVRCETGDRERVYGQGWSDHLPVVGEFGRSGTGLAGVGSR